MESNIDATMSGGGWKKAEGRDCHTVDSPSRPCGEMLPLEPNPPSRASHRTAHAGRGAVDQSHSTAPAHGLSVVGDDRLIPHRQYRAERAHTGETGAGRRSWQGPPRPVSRANKRWIINCAAIVTP